MNRKRSRSQQKSPLLNGNNQNKSSDKQTKVFEQKNSKTIVTRHPLLQENEKEVPQAISVCVRIRPLLKPQEDEEAWSISKKLQQISLIIDVKNQNQRYQSDAFESEQLFSQKEGKQSYNESSSFSSSQLSFNFENIEDSFTRTQSIYNRMCKPIIEQVLQGYHGAILCYGQTTSGKTFTMLGEPENPGILPCSVRDIFSLIQKKNEKSEENQLEFNIWITEDPKWGTLVTDLKMQRVWSFEQAIVLMNFGEEHRIYRETSVHEHSSRSHTVFKIFIESYEKDLSKGFKRARYSSLNLVDLAGSERLSEVNEGNQGISNHETGFINKSLFVLANCINKLAEGKKQHIPYRDSKLTRILSSSLGGNSLTSIICCISPAVCNFTQTLSTLRFATRARVIFNKPKINEIGNPDESQSNQFLLEKITTQEVEIEELKVQNNTLKENVTYLDSQTNELTEQVRQILQRLNEEQQNSFNLCEQLKKQRDEFSRIEQNKSISPDNRVFHPSFFENVLAKLIETLPNFNTGTEAENQRLSNFFDSTVALKNQCMMQQESVMRHFCTQLKQLLLKLTSKEQEQQILIDNLSQIANTYSGINFLSQTQANTHHLHTIEQQRKFELARKISERSVFFHIKYNFGDMLGEIFSNIPRESSLKAYKQNLELIEQHYEQTLNQFNSCLQIAKADLSSLFSSQRKQLFTRVPPTQEDEIREHTISTLSHSLQEIYETEVKKLLLSFQSAFTICKQHISINSLNHQDLMDLQFQNEQIQNTNCSNQNKFITSSSDQSYNPIYSAYGIGNTNLQSSISSNKSSVCKTPKFDIVEGKKLEIKELMKSLVRKNDNYPQKPQEIGVLYIWGSGKDGRLGLDTEESQKFPQIIQEFKVSLISLGYHHSACITPTGALYTWGRGNCGQLGHGKNENILTPRILRISPKIELVSIACGWQHTIALTKDGNVFSWGFGEDGQLGLGHFETVNRPEKIKSLEGVMVHQIQVGHSHSAVVTSDGVLLMFGCNVDHRLMSQSNQNSPDPILTELEFLHQEYGSDYEVLSVSLGVNHSSVVTRNGNLYTSGQGNDGQLGSFISEDLPNSLMVPKENCRQAESFFNSSTLSSMNQVGFEEKTEVSETNDFDRICYFNKVKTFHQKNKAIFTSCGDSFTLVINEQNQVYSFGKGSYCRLGHTDLKKGENVYEPRIIQSLKNYQIVKVSTGCRHATAIADDGKMYSWGFNFYDQLGHGQSQQDFEKPTKIVKLAGLSVAQSSCGYFHTAAIIV